MERMAGIEGWSFERAEPLSKGLSGDKKFHAWAGGAEYLVRISGEDSYEDKLREFRLLQKASGLGLAVPEPVEFGRCGEGVYTLLDWVPGKDVDQVVPELPQREQYRLGREAGALLRRFHEGTAADPGEDWSTRYFAVLEPRLEAYREEGTPFVGSDQIMEFLERERGLLTGRPQTMHHGDYHMGNMVLGEDGRLTVIDWDTADFGSCGDPWYEFNRMSTKIPAFAAGQVDGYFSGQVSPEFWKLLAYYMTAATITSIVWAKYFAPECMGEIMESNMALAAGYDGMRRLVPEWYREDWKTDFAEKES